jgi:putative peptide zinc metalloprotease protein
MNLTEAFNTALPEIPVLSAKERYPRIHPKLVGREHMEESGPLVTAVISGKAWLYQFSPAEWELVQLFDGVRSYEQISDLYFEQFGVRYDPGEIREMAANLDSMEFWYKTPQELNTTLIQKLADQRSQKAKKKSKYGDISHLQFSAWDPDEWFDRILPWLEFVYTRWFTLLTLAAFAFMTYVFIDRWEEIGRDTLQFYNFREKGFWDIVEFWFLACGVLFIHESAHGLTCKHYGGHVHRMGFHLIYLTPAFFTDVTEAWVYANRWQRVVTIVSGAWSEMVICAIATAVWWGTPYGTFVHDFAYKLILITGLGVLFFNWNPLIKLDGYYLVTEILALPQLKEDSTAYVTGWVKKYIWRLPVEVPYVPKRRRLGYVVYGMLSGMYSYSLLYVVARFAGNVVGGFIGPEWAFIPATAAGLLIFRSRITILVRFMNNLYLDKKDRLLALLTPRNKLIAGVAVALLLVLPIWRETEEGRFLLEPANRAVVRAAVPGTVVEVNAEEGRKVAAGEALLRLRNLSLESQAAQARADARVAAARATNAQLHYAAFGTADLERQQLAERSRLLQNQVAMLILSSPVAGQVMTPRVADRIGSRVEPGTELVEVADLSTLRARIYLPEFAVRKTEVGANARLLPEAEVISIPGKVLSVAPVSSEIEAGLTEHAQYRGIRPPTFYVVTIEVPNPRGDLKAGMAGTALITAARRSVASLTVEAVWNFVRRKVW